MGHRQAVRDVSFNTAGTQFLSASYDRFIKLWDTETGKCSGQFNLKKVAYCVKFNPDEDKQHLFLAGCADKKILCVSWYLDYLVMLDDIYLVIITGIWSFDNQKVNYKVIFQSD